MGNVTDNFIEYCNSVFRLSSRHKVGYNPNNSTLVDMANYLVGLYNDGRKYTLELVKIRLYELLCETESLPNFDDVAKSVRNYLGSENTKKYDLYDFIIKYRDDDEFISPLLTYIDID